ncbi:MAG TPA: efflux RND transporter periplasmic adaptor subunit [Dongiaceae bacterium]|nr:efflux RND transporter periplasmic adaptor subunit [Dongiaceae bacterium]
MRCLWMASAMGVALAAASCGDSAPVSPGVTNAANPPAVTAAPVVSKPAAVVAEPADSNPNVVFGPIIVEHQIEMTAQHEGIVEKIFVDAPARVKAGTLLAKMDDRQVEANLEAARAKTRSIAADLKNWQAEAQVLEADYGRAKQLWDSGLISQEQLEHAKYKAESDKWDIQRVQETLNTAKHEELALELEAEKSKVIAPFDGLIARRYVREGQNVAKGDRLFWVTAEGPLLMRFTLPEKMFGQVRAGQAFDVISADIPGEKHTARVKEISPVVDPASGTFEVLVEFVGERGAFRPGMTAEVQLATRQ